jgi:hypothetical protein
MLCQFQFGPFGQRSGDLGPNSGQVRATPPGSVTNPLIGMKLRDAGPPVSRSGSDGVSVHGSDVGIRLMRALKNR